MKRLLSVILAVSIVFSAVFMVPVFAAYENTHINTGNQIEDLIGVAATQVGYREGNSSSQLTGTVAGSENYTKYGQWYGINPGAWCAMFVSWCANQAGISTSVIPKHASCDVGMNWFKNQGRWGWGKYWGNYQGKTVYTPVRGDIIYFGNGNLNDSTHVGIVYKADGTYVYTIEGNTSNKCAYKQYRLGDDYIYGYGHPAYSGDTAPTGASEISISTDATYPTSLAAGQSFSLKGTVSSKYNLTKVRAGIYNANGTLNGISAERTPNATAFSISSVDASIKFGSLSAGMYTYCIEACDANDTYAILLMQPFSVGGASGNTVTFTYQVTASSLNLRSGPGTSYSTVGSLPNGAAIEVQKVLNGWAYTTYSGVSGWCSMSYLNLQESYGGTATPVPTATPATLAGNLFFNADYTTGSTTDTVGKLEGTKGTSGTVSFVTNATGTRVAAFDGTACLEYDLAQHANKVASDFTMETYVKLNGIPNTWANIAGTYWYNNTSGFGIGYGQFSELGTGASEFSFSTGVAGSSTTYNTAFTGALSGQWVHLVYSNNGSREVLYANGSKVSEKALPVSNIAFDNERTFRVGGYNTVGQFCADMECAFVRIYARAATASEVSALYAARPSLSAATPTPVPTATPTAAPTVTPVPLNASMFFNADYTAGSAKDQVGKLAGTKGSAGTVSYVNDSSTGTKVASFSGEACLEYDFSKHADKINSNFAMEAYVKLENAPSWGWGLIAGTYWYNDHSGFGMGYGQFSEIGTGTGNFSFTTGDTENSTTYNKTFTGAAAGQWVHLVYSNNGSKAVLYVNGSKVTSQTLPVSDIVFDSARTFRVGGYNTVGQFCNDMDCAYIRLYSRAVTAAEVRSLYAARPVAAMPAPTQVPTPTPNPTEEPTPAPLRVTYTSGKTDGKKTDAVALNETFSIEICAIPKDNGYFVFNARYPVELSNGHISVWEFTHPEVVFSSNAEIKIGELVHLVITGSGDTLKLYVNGQYDSSTYGEMVLGNDNFNFENIMQLGLNAGSEYIFNVYNREATVEEVAELYKNYKPVSKTENMGSLIFTSRPAKLYYEVGEKLDLTGLSVFIKDEKGVKIPVAIEDCTITGNFDSNTVGIYPMTIKYETENIIYSNIFTLTVCSKNTVAGIGLAVKPSKLYYEYGETLDTTGLSVLVKYSDGTTATVSDGLKVIGYDATVCGNQRLTVSYGGQSTSFSIKVYPRGGTNVIGIGLETKPKKLVYAYGEALDITGLTILAKNSDGTIIHGISDNVKVTGYEANCSGPQVLTVTYAGYTTHFTVSVVEGKSN